MAKQSLEGDLIRHSYDNVIERCARLVGFSSRPSIDFESGDIESRRRNLAKDDIINLAINARRLAAACNVKMTNSKFGLPTYAFEIQRKVELKTLPGKIALQEIFGVIIHSKWLEILEMEFEVRLFFDPHAIKTKRFSFTDLEFDPKVAVRSDKPGCVVFDVGELVSSIDKYLLPPVMAAAEKHKIYLDKTWFT